MRFQSPQWGDNSKVPTVIVTPKMSKFQSPQWGDNSKALKIITYVSGCRFSPRNGEIILKGKLAKNKAALKAFQSPQWEDNSKECHSI